MRWTPWSFCGEVTVMSPHDDGTHLEWRVGDEGSLPNSFGWEFILLIKTHFYGGALTSHFTEEHSSPTSLWSVFMVTSSNGNMFRVTGFCAGNSPVTAGNSPITGEFPLHRPVMRSFDVFFDLRLNKRLSKQSRRRWVETSSHDPGSCGIFQRSTHHCCPILNWWNGSNWGGGGGGGSVIMEGMASNLKRNTALPWLPFLEINYILQSAAVKFCGVRSPRN